MSDAKILDGNKLANLIYEDISKQVKARLISKLRVPGLAVVLVGDNSASKIYVEKKRKTCQKLGFVSKDHNLPIFTSETELLSLIDELNNDDEIDGILVQIPLPEHINANKIFNCIRPDKDVDGFHPYNIGRLSCGQQMLCPCTSHGVMTLIKHYVGDNLQGIDAVIVGHSNVVGKPMALELLAANATVSVCHAFTGDIKPYIEKATLLIVAVGKPELIKGTWIKEGAIVVDVGINRLANGKIVGDVEFDVAKERASWITKVPGGVGPMTVATLMQNTLFAIDNLH